MRGQFLPYNTINLTGIAFCGIAIVLAITQQLSLAFIAEPCVILVMSILIATQILRNRVYASETRDMTLSFDMTTKLLVFKGTEAASDVFNSMNKNTGRLESWEGVVHVSRVAWVEKTIRGTIVHCDDASIISGRLSKHDYNVLTNSLATCK